MESVKKSIGERAQHKMEYERRVNERQIQTTEEKTNTSNALDALDASSVIIESNRTESKEQDTSSRSWNDAHVDDADIRPIYNEEPMAESQFLKEKGNEAKVKNDIDVIETTNIELEHSVAKLLVENEQLHKEKEHLKQTYKDLFDSIKRTRVQTKNHNDSLMEQLNKKSNENADVLAQIQKKGFAIAALKNELRKLTGNSVNTKFAKPSILGKPVGQPLKNQSVVRQPTAFKSERPRISKPRFASQVDVNNDLSKPVTTHHLPKGRGSAPAKPHHMIAPSSSRFPKERHRPSKQQWMEMNPQMVQNADIPNQCESEQPLNVKFQASVVNDKWRPPALRKKITLSLRSTGVNVKRRLIAADQASVFMAMTSDHNRSELGIQDHSNEQSSSKLVPKVVP
ncbi:hypothetical protein Tco_1568275 [Tanacetum coccineum]